MTQIVAISNQKGGVGKTTTAVNLSTALAATGYKTLLIDLDPQRNASVSVAVSPRKHTTYTFLVGKHSLEEVVTETFVPNLYLMASSVDLAAFELEVAQTSQREYFLRKRLLKSSQDYEFIFIDCPPSFGTLCLNAWNTAQWVLIPLQCEYYALEGLVLLLNNILKVKKSFNPQLTIGGILLTMYDKRSVLARQIEEDVRQNLGSKVFDTKIPRNIKIAEAPSHGKPVLFYDLRCPGSLAYMDLAKEFLSRQMFNKEVQ